VPLAPARPRAPVVRRAAPAACFQSNGDASGGVRRHASLVVSRSPAVLALAFQIRTHWPVRPCKHHTGSSCRSPPPHVAAPPCRSHHMSPHASTYVGDALVLSTSSTRGGSTPAMRAAAETTLLLPSSGARPALPPTVWARRVHQAASAGGRDGPSPPALASREDTEVAFHTFTVAPGLGSP
jgi:hypothetical protein